MRAMATGHPRLSRAACWDSAYMAAGTFPNAHDSRSSLAVLLCRVCHAFPWLGSKLGRIHISAEATKSTSRPDLTSSLTKPSHDNLRHCNIEKRRMYHNLEGSQSCISASTFSRRLITLLLHHITLKVIHGAHYPYSVMSPRLYPAQALSRASRAISRAPPVCNPIPSLFARLVSSDASTPSLQKAFRSKCNRTTNATANVCSPAFA